MYSGAGSRPSRALLGANWGPLTALDPQIGGDYASLSADGWAQCRAQLRCPHEDPRNVARRWLRTGTSSGPCGTPQFMCQAQTMAGDDDFAAVERRIREHQGEQFYTQSGLPMTYEFKGNRIKVSRAQPLLSMDEARRIWEMGPDATLTNVDQRITGRAYLFAILHDPRITSWATGGG